MNNETAIDGDTAPRPLTERTLLANFRLRREPRGEQLEGKAGHPAFDFRIEHTADRLRVIFHGRIDRKIVLTVQERLKEIPTPVRQVQLDLSDARGLTLPTLAPLAMLGGELERLGYEVGIVGVPPELQRKAIAARLHHLVNFE